MIRIIQDPVTMAFYWSCPYCCCEIEFYEVMPPVTCPKCNEILPFNPMSLIEEFEARIEFFFEKEPYFLEVY